MSSTRRMCLCQVTLLTWQKLGENELNYGRIENNKRLKGCHSYFQKFVVCLYIFIYLMCTIGSSSRLATIFSRELLKTVIELQLPHAEAHVLLHVVGYTQQLKSFCSGCPMPGWSSHHSLAVCGRQPGSFLDGLICNMRLHTLWATTQ